MTSLLKAAKEGSASRCRQLLDAGSCVEVRDEDGFTPFLLAADNGHTEVCELLLERGKVNIEEKTLSGDGALNLAVFKGRAKTVKMLMSKGAMVDTRNNSGFTLLLSAADEGHVDVCKLLLAVNSNVEERMPSTLYTPLHFAAINGNETIIELLLSHNADVNSRSKTEAAPLHLASQEGHLVAVVALLQAGADPFLPRQGGALPIHQAANKNHSQVARILIEQAGCSPDQVSPVDCPFIVNLSIFGPAAPRKTTFLTED